MMMPPETFVDHNHDKVIVLDSVPQEEAEPSFYSKIRTKVHTFNTVLGWMTLKQYGAHVASLTPKTIKRGYTVLSCGHKFSSAIPPRRGCTVCWNAFFESRPEQVAFLKVGLDEGYGSEIRARYGSESTNQLVRKIAEDAEEAVNVGIFNVAEHVVASAQTEAYL